MTIPANDPPPPRPAAWIFAAVQLADGRTLELRIPTVIAGSITTYEPDPGEPPTIALIDEHGRRRRGRLDQLLGAP